MTLKSSLAISYLLAACSSAGLNGNATPKGLTQQAPASSQAAAGDTDGSKNGTDVAQDSETAKATAPVSVSGSFLTSSCDIASANDGFIAVADQDAYGCAIQNNDKTKYTGPVTFSSVAVDYMTDAGTLAALNEAPRSSRWHTYFYLPVSERGQIKTYHMAGAIDANQAFNLSFTPAAGNTPARSDTLSLADQAAVGAANKAAAAKAAETMQQLQSPGAPTDCKPISTDYAIDPAFPWAMDSANAAARATLRGDEAKGGKPLGLEPAGGGFKAGDLLSLTGFSGKSAVNVLNGVSNTMYQDDCPAGWLLHFLDANNKILNPTDAALSSFKNTNRGVPAGAVRATIGYNEPAGKLYVDNEGNPAIAMKNPTGGCQYKFTVTRACK